MTEQAVKRSVRIEIVFDGGSRGNPGPSYGSYQIKQGAKPLLPPVRLSLGHGTNNEAEYRTLIAALDALKGELEQAGPAPARIKLVVRGDSQLVIRQIKGEWKAKNPRMRSLRDQVLQLADGFGSVEWHHHARWRSVAALGH